MKNYVLYLYVRYVHICNCEMGAQGYEILGKLGEENKKKM